MTPPKRTPESEGPQLTPQAAGRSSAVARRPQEPQTLPEHLRTSRDRIYESMMRGGGEPFGQPFAMGLSSLTQAVARKIKQKGFYAFETLERAGPTGDQEANKFTRYGAAPFRGDHPRKRKPT